MQFSSQKIEISKKNCRTFWVWVSVLDDTNTADVVIAVLGVTTQISTLRKLWKWWGSPAGKVDFMADWISKMEAIWGCDVGEKGEETWR